MITSAAALVSLALAMAAPSQPQQAPPNAALLLPVIVRAVDAQWLPIPGVRIVAQDDDGRVVAQGVTDREGQVDLRVPVADRDAVFDLSALMNGFKPAALQDLWFGQCARGCSQPRYVQIQLEVAGPLLPRR